MALRSLRNDDSIDTIADELVYTQAKMLADDKAKDLAGFFNVVIASADAAKASQITNWRNELRAQALVDYRDEELDGLVRDFGDDLKRSVGKNTDDPRYRLYFKSNPTAVIKLGLQSELEKVASWPAQLDQESDANLKAYAAKFRQAIADGQAAIDARNHAASATAVQRAREIAKLLDDANAIRKSSYGTLFTRAGQQKLAQSWAERFFRHEAHTVSAPAPAATPPASAAQG